MADTFFSEETFKKNYPGTVFIVHPSDFMLRTKNHLSGGKGDESSDLWRQACNLLFQSAGLLLLATFTQLSLSCRRNERAQTDIPSESVGKT